MKQMIKKTTQRAASLVDAFVSNASNRMHATGTIATTLLLAFGFLVVGF